MLPRETDDSEDTHETAEERRQRLGLTARRSSGTENSLDQATVLIISDDPEFSRVVMDRWQGERHAPAFTLMSAGVCRDLDADGFDLAIVGGSRAPQFFLPYSTLSIHPASQ